jgi:hypothetical protein
MQSVRFNFGIRPLESMEPEENGRLNDWFLAQYKEKRTANSRWRQYNTVNEEDFMYAGNQDLTDSWMPVYAFEGSVQFYLEEEMGLSIYMCAGDPSLIIYLIMTIFPGYTLKYHGDHYISVDRRPDKLRNLLD